MEHTHTNGVTHSHPNRAEECYVELAKVLERYRCTLRAVLQVGEGNVIVPVVQVAELEPVPEEVPHG